MPETDPLVRRDTREREVELMTELRAAEQTSRTWELHALDLERRLAAATEALRKIANEDYRGSRPHSAIVAEQALTHEVDPW